MMGWYHDGSWGWGGWILMTLAMAAVWGGVIAAIVVLFRSNDRKSDVTERLGSDRGPKQLLAERFARGEIDEAEYRARLGVLQGDAATSGPPPATSAR